MSEDSLILIMRRFAGGQIDAPLFVESYMAEWRRRRDSGGGSGIFDRAFTAADCFSPEPRTAGPFAGIDISADRLRSEITQLIRELPGSQPS